MIDHRYDLTDEAGGFVVVRPNDIPQDPPVYDVIFMTEGGAPIRLGLNGRQLRDLANAIHPHTWGSMQDRQEAHARWHAYRVRTEGV